MKQHYAHLRQQALSALYLRNKLERGDGARIIHTVRGAGYVLSFREPEGLS